MLNFNDFGLFVASYWQFFLSIFVFLGVLLFVEVAFVRRDKISDYTLKLFDYIWVLLACISAISSVYAFSKNNIAKDITENYKKSIDNIRVLDIEAGQELLANCGYRIIVGTSSDTPPASQEKSKLTEEESRICGSKSVMLNRISNLLASRPFIEIPNDATSSEISLALHSFPFHKYDLWMGEAASSQTDGREVSTSYSVGFSTPDEKKKKLATYIQRFVNLRIDYVETYLSAVATNKSASLIITAGFLLFLIAAALRLTKSSVELRVARQKARGG